MCRVVLQLGIACTLPLVNVYAQPNSKKDDLAKLTIPENVKQRVDTSSHLTFRQYWLKKSKTQVTGTRPAIRASFGNSFSSAVSLIAA